PSGRLVGVSERPASAAIAEMLGLAQGAPILMVETVRGSTPALLIYSYHVFDRDRFAGIDAAVARSGSYTEALREFGVERFFR
ncbi:UTRA domain-containing protein, partial [Acinetobacter baumannii]